MSETEALPPYFNINPDEALADLGAPVGAEDFARIARSCAEGRADLVARGLNPDGSRRLRPFSTWEITRYLIPVAPAHFRRVLRANPGLPQGKAETEAGAKWFTLDEVLRLRAHFAAEGSRAKEYRPFRPEGLPAKIAAIANFKGGVGKTSTAAHLAMSAALDGYRVLVIDLDSQGSMTSIFGGTVPDEWSTVFPLLARDYALSLREENRRRVERGDPPHPLDPLLDTALERTARDIIQKTHWPNIDLIGAQLNLYWAEFQIPVWRMTSRGWKLWDALGNALERDGILDAYDLVILDTPPALGYLTINALAAADIHVLTKHGVKEIAWSKGQAATFMAKYDQAQAGSSCNVHQSLRSLDGAPAFFEPGAPHGMSALMRSYLAGLLAHADEITLFLAPYVNSYKRFVAGTFAPTRAVWSADNRTKYFSLDNCGSNIATFSTGRTFGDGQQASHWKDNLGIGILDPTAARGERLAISATDLQLYDAIGWNVVPEPGTMALLGFGLAGIFGLRRRKA